MDTRKVRRQIVRLAEAQNWRCCYCQHSIELNEGDISQPNTATIEHFVPKARGGSNNWTNLVMACSLCNNLRGDAWAYDFAAVVELLHRNDLIRNVWHKLTPHQVKLLRLEVRYGLAQRTAHMPRADENDYAVYLKITRKRSHISHP